MYFFVLQKFAEIQKDYEGDKIVVYRDSPSEGLTKWLFHYAKWEIIKKKIIPNLWHQVTWKLPADILIKENRLAYQMLREYWTKVSLSKVQSMEDEVLDMPSLPFPLDSLWKETFSFTLPSKKSWTS